MHRLLWTLLAGAVVLAGCAEAPVPPDAPNEAFPGWDSVNRLCTDIMPSIGVAAERGEWAAVKQIASGEDFQKLVGEIAAETIPSKYATAARKEGKAKLDKSLKDLVEGAKNNAPDEEIETAMKGVNEAIKAISQ